jgi:hypothetical protein
MPPNAAVDCQKAVVHSKPLRQMMENAPGVHTPNGRQPDYFDDLVFVEWTGDEYMP